MISECRLKTALERTQNWSTTRAATAQTRTNCSLLIVILKLHLAMRTYLPIERINERRNCVDARSQSVQMFGTDDQLLLEQYTFKYIQNLLQTHRVKQGIECDLAIKTNFVKYKFHFTCSMNMYLRIPSTRSRCLTAWDGKFPIWFDRRSSQHRARTSSPWWCLQGAGMAAREWHWAVETPTWCLQPRASVLQYREFERTSWTTNCFDATN